MKLPRPGFEPALKRLGRTQGRPASRRLHDLCRRCSRRPLHPARRSAAATRASAAQLIVRVVMSTAAYTEIVDGERQHRGGAPQPRLPNIQPTALAVHAARSATATFCAAEALTRKVVQARFTYAVLEGRQSRPR